MRNRAKCKNCGDVIESKYRHDFVSCSCFRNEEGSTGIAIDGGTDYFRWIGNMDNFVWIDDEEETE